MEKPIKIDDLGGFPPIFGSTPIFHQEPKAKGGGGSYGGGAMFQLL